MKTRGKFSDKRSKMATSRVLHLSSAHPWTDNRVHFREAASLASFGYDTWLYAVDNSLDVERDTQVKVTRVPPSHRVKRMTIGSIKAIRFAFKSRARLVHIHDPELIWGIPLLRLAGRIVVYDAHEDLPSQVMHKPYLPLWVRRFVAEVTRCMLRIANTSDAIICATETVALRFDATKTTVVRNFPENVELGELKPVLERPVCAVYVGGLSEARGTPELVKAFSDQSLRGTWTLELAGNVQPSLLNTITELAGWESVNFHGMVPPLVARQLMAEAQVGMVVLRDTPNHRDALPTKMFEYMASGTPVIASDFPLWRQILEEHDCGLLVPPENPAAIARAIDSYRRQPEMMERHSKNGLRAVAESLNWQAESGSLVKAYASIGVHPASDKTTANMGF